MYKIVFTLTFLVPLASHAAPSEWLSCQPHGDAIGPIALQLQSLDSQKTEVVMTIVGDKIEVPSEVGITTSVATATQKADNLDAPEKIQDQVGTLAQIDGASESAQGEAVSVSSDSPVLPGLAEQGQLTSEVSVKDFKSMTKLGRFQFVMRRFGSVEIDGQLTQAALLDLSNEKPVSTPSASKRKEKKVNVSGVLAYRGAVYPLDCKVEAN